MFLPRDAENKSRRYPMCLKIDDPGVLEIFCLGFKEKWHQLQAHFIQIQDQSKGFPRHNKGNHRVDVYNGNFNDLLLRYHQKYREMNSYARFLNFMITLRKRVSFRDERPGVQRFRI